MILRLATVDDVKVIFEWANDDDMRINSFESKSIEWEEHVIWYNNKLSSNNSIIFIAESEEHKNIGQIRFDKYLNYAKIDFYITKEFRSQGFGCEILTKGIGLAFSHWIDLEFVKGEVKKENLASQKAFLKASFSEQYKNELFVYVKKNETINRQ